MKKIAIVTLNGYSNYGNRLQNYALQETLKNFGYDVETLKINLTSNREIIKSFLRKSKYFIKNPRVYSLKKEREKIFKDFCNNYIVESTTDFFLDDDLSYLNSEFNYFVTGSDQVWNPFMNKMSSFYFLNFAQESKRITYAPSFGITELSNDTERYYKKWISDIPFLSVREEEGSNIIKKLTGRDSKVVVDPTMLLTKEKWLSISKIATTKTDDNYLLTYFLGGIPEEYREQINFFAKKNSLKIINLSEIKDQETYCTGPSEFIEYINSGCIFFTDSFHGVIFSILMETPFIVYERKTINGTMYSRIETLLEKFDLKNREIKNIDFKKNVFDLDFSKAKNILNNERQKAFEFLSNALDHNSKDENIK